ncbi:MAG TPA: pyrimidine 5'-nucleotidase [Burkholderiales bacterium]|nr:pyrimidine 5'-nucleotidase [Burkholderiales bacterium]
MYAEHRRPEIGPVHEPARRCTWIFDLDNTLHDADQHVFPFLHRSMNEYIQTHLGLDAEEAAQLRRHYWLKYGATLNGLIRHHGTNPSHFLKATHQLPDPLRMILRPPALRDTLRRLPGRKIIFSNAPRDYANLVLTRLGLAPYIDAVYTIEDTAYRGKPDRRSFHALISDARLNPRKCIMVEDSLANLRTAKALGMKTVWIDSGVKTPGFVDVRIRSVAQVNLIARVSNRVG